MRVPVGELMLDVLGTRRLTCCWAGSIGPVRWARPGAEGAYTVPIIKMGTLEERWVGMQISKRRMEPRCSGALFRTLSLYATGTQLLLEMTSKDSVSAHT